MDAAAMDERAGAAAPPAAGGADDKDVPLRLPDGRPITIEFLFIDPFNSRVARDVHGNIYAQEPAGVWWRHDAATGDWVTTTSDGTEWRYTRWGHYHVENDATAFTIGSGGSVTAEPGVVVAAQSPWGDMALLPTGKLGAVLPSATTQPGTLARWVDEAGEHWMLMPDGSWAVLHQASFDRPEFGERDKPNYLLATAEGNFMSGGKMTDWMLGRDGPDKLMGDEGNDILSGQGGNDSLHGGNGDDWLNGGTGNDLLNGGEGADSFAFDAGGGTDTIFAFEHGKDKIVLGPEFRDAYCCAAELIAAMEQLDTSTVRINLVAADGTQSAIIVEWANVSKFKESDFIFVG